MISRHLLRIKALMILYAYFKSDDKSQKKFESDLFFSINKTYDLYILLFVLIVDIKNYAEDKINLAKQKRIPTHEDLYPNTKFIDNKVIHLLEINKSISSYVLNNKISWTENPELIKQLYNNIIQSSIYEAYMNDEQSDYKNDKQFIIDIFANIIVNSEFISQIIEEKSIYWNDDIEFVVSMIIKTINGIKENDDEYKSLMSLFKNEDDRDFVKNLFRKTILNHENNKTMINDFTKNWDFDRIAFMDKLIMEAAITEVVEFPSIPIKVSLNEYIEISKYYSTEKSSVFINGVLDKIINKLQEDNGIVKTGRGLMQ
ncbi:MAG: transcription antitermination factor NusB [Bacteroidetes bacterium]|nr:transcription antitermination factor NusB [Bacteroidota bacterium]